MITWPLTTGINLGWQYTAFQKATFQYQFRFDGFHADTTTSDAFVVPSSTTTQWTRRRVRIPARRLQPGAQRRVVRAIELEPWGLPIQRSRTTGLPRRSVPTCDTAATCHATSFSGPSESASERRLLWGDQPGSVQPIPVRPLRRYAHSRRARLGRAVRRSGDGARHLHVRPAPAVSVRPVPRSGLGTGPAASRDWQPLTGFGVAFNVRAPYNTILRADVGHAWLPAQYRGIGSTVVQILLLKPLGK